MAVTRIVTNDQIRTYADFGAAVVFYPGSFGTSSQAHRVHFLSNMLSSFAGQT